MPIELTPELAARMLSIYERRLLDDPGKVYDKTLLEAALAPEPPALPKRVFHFAGGLKRPNWKHDKGSRG